MRYFNTAITRICLSLCFIILSAAANAVPARPGVRQNLTLTDGTVVNALLVGDEHGHYWLADDGKAYRNEGDIFVEIDLKSTLVKAQERRREVNSRRSRRIMQSGRKQNPSAGYHGRKKGLIILVNFSDVAFKDGHDNDLFMRIANEEGLCEGNFVGSVYDYFYAQSEGQFEMTFDVAGPFTISEKQAYYGENFGKDDTDKHAAEMVIEALYLADDQVNYADYDWDGDGEVDQVYILYAGKNEADGGGSKTIWPHEWFLSEALFAYGDGTGDQTLDDVLIDTYACGSELDYMGKIAGIGTICHEFSHCLGYPDYYDTDYSGGQGMHTWDLMDSGAYNGNGFIPAGFTSYERWVAGWKTPIELTDTTYVSSMKALQDGGDTYVIYNKGHMDEFYLLENRQKVKWDSGIPGSGLLILHVDYNDSIWHENEPNGDPRHQRMTWVAADDKYQYTMYSGVKYFSDKGAADDPFPYDSVNTFNRYTTPAATFYNENIDGTYFLDSSVEDITQNQDGTVSFSFIFPYNGSSPGETGVGVKRIQENVDIWYDLSGRRLDAVPTTPNIYINSGRKKVIR